MNEQKTNGSVTGFFAATGPEISTLTKEKILNTGEIGRMGIHYDKQALINTMKSNGALKQGDIGIAEIKVPHEVIVKANENVFGIKKGNQLKILELLPLSTY